MTFKFSVQSDPVKIIKQGDPGFSFSSGVTFCNRAGLEISNTCPNEHRWIIQQCIEHGWIKPFAVMKESEYMWVSLKEEQ